MRVYVCVCVYTWEEHRIYILKRSARVACFLKSALAAYPYFDANNVCRCASKASKLTTSAALPAASYAQVLSLLASKASKLSTVTPSTALPAASFRASVLQ
jgi:hypothetical protein